MESQKISRKMLKRLPAYLIHLRSLPENSENVSATAIAKALGLGDVQVRKDLAKVSGSGRRRTGRCREQLIADIENYLDFATQTGTVIVGAGKLGQALLDYTGFQGSGLEVLAGFDIKPSSRRTGSGKPILPMEKLESFCREKGVQIAVITVPAQSAQSVCDRLVACGIRAIWNFAPVHLKAPPHVVIQSENLAVSIASLRMQLKQIEEVSDGI